jgi:hypothetical protein
MNDTMEQLKAALDDTSAILDEHGDNEKEQAAGVPPGFAALGLDATDAAEFCALIYDAEYAAGMIDEIARAESGLAALENVKGRMMTAMMMGIALGVRVGRAS